jgi:hypothetical protein
MTGSLRSAPDADTSEMLTVAFGDDPGRWPLPAASTPLQLWLRAVAAGGQGRYAHARADLAALRRDRAAGPQASLAHSTHASFLRQLGWHALARGWDGRALALADAATEPAATSHTEAAADALIGLAADALGTGRFPASARLLERVETLLEGGADPSIVPGRLPLRLGWVAAELAMVSGDGAGAVRHAELAADLARTSPSARHRVKTDVVLAAALCSAGNTARSRSVADDALAVTGRHGLIPLRWALACLLADIGSDAHTSEQVHSIRNACVVAVERAGGIWRR